MFYNLRLRISCKIIGWAILIMPAEWRTRKAINNMMSVDIISNTVSE